MFKEKSLEVVQGSFPMQFQNNIFSLQDNQNPINNSNISANFITNKEKDFIIQNNKAFFVEYKIIYLKNIELKNKLSELIQKKKELYDSIIKLEQKFKDSQSLNEKKTTNNNSNINKNLNYIFIPYTKKKRIRRKKTEIVNKYNCNFHDCNKSYPSKCSLNMHVRLKHLETKKLSC